MTTTIVTAIIVFLFLYYFILTNNLMPALIVMVLSFIAFIITYLVESPFLYKSALGSLIATLLFVCLVGAFIIYCNIADKYHQWKSE